MSVDVVRDVGLCVAEPLCNDLHRNARRLQCQGRARVTKAVELIRRTPDASISFANSRWPMLLVCVNRVDKTSYE